MEVKIGVLHAPRELVLESEDEPEAVKQTVTNALGGKAPVLALTDDKGRQFVVPADKISYVEIAPTSARGRVGFA